MSAGTRDVGGAEADFAFALRAAIADRGLTLDRLRHHLGARGHHLSVATLSYWQSGRSRPERAASLAALEALEDVLRVSPGALVELARRAREAHGAPTRLESVAAITPDGAVMDEMVAALGLEWKDGLRRTSVHEQVWVRPDRSEGRHCWRETVRAERSGVDRYPACFQYDDPNSQVECVGIAHVRVGRVVRDRARRLLVAEIILPRALEAGESITLEHALEYDGNTVPLEYCETGTLTRLRDFHLSVRFEGPDIPLWAEAYQVLDGEETWNPLPVAGPVQELHLPDFGPGVAGIRWHWSPSAAMGQGQLPHSEFG